MSRRWLSAVAGLAASAAMAGTAFANAPVTQHLKVTETVTPVLSIPVRDMPRTGLPAVMQQIVGNRHLSQQQLQQLRDKLVNSGFLNPAGQPRVIPLRQLPHQGGAVPRVTDRHIQAQIGTRNGFTTGVNFAGIGVSGGDTIGCAPPDTNAAVGGGYVVEIVNLCNTGSGEFKVWDTDGNVVQGTTALASLWSSGECTNGLGDNQVSYDQFANRWILSQFNGGPTGICMAVSQTSDPTGAYYLYDIVIDPTGFTDYPKTGKWVTGDDNSDAYIITTNDFTSPFEDSFTAVQRSAMLAGSAAEVINAFDSGSVAGGALPADIDGMNMAPAGDPGLFFNFTSPYLAGTGYQLNVWQMSVDWGANSGTLTGPTAITVDAFNDGICSLSRSCIPQPSGGEGLDSLGDRLMFRLAYRNGMGGDGHQVLLVNHTVGTGAAPSNPPAGIHWYELDAPAGSTSVGDWSVVQQGTYMPDDGTSRWMASIAMDHVGNIGMGYTMSSSSLNPSMGVTGQNVGATPGVMDAGETMVVAGGGVQESTFNRWGDYSSIMTDPSDDCTFWAADEYISETGSFHWSTYLGSFKFDNCSIGPTGTLAGTITDANSGDPISGAKVVLDPGSAQGVSHDDGTYSITTSPGDYTATASAFGYNSSSADVTINQDQTTPQDFALTPSTTANLHGRVYDSGHGYPLYAEVKVKYNGSTVADVWTNPGTGTYSVQLPTGNSYDITATAYFDGYTAGTATVALNGDKRQWFSLEPDSSCSAPGYEITGGISQGFESAFPPNGWAVANDYAGAQTVWARNDNVSCASEGNYTGGTGYTAVADSNYAGFYCGDYGSYDTSLISPPINVGDLGGNTTLAWLESFALYSGSEALDVDISTDGGTTWNNVQHQTADCGDVYVDGCSESVDLSGVLPPSGNFQLRWRYYNLASGYDWYAQVDNVTLGNPVCTAVPGGLMQGAAIDANTLGALTGVTVTDENGNSTQTASSNGHTGFMMFEPSGSHTLTASKSNYQDNAKTISIGNGQVKATVFAMRAGMLEVNPTSFDVNVTAGTVHNVQLNVSNVGTAPADAQLSSIDAPPVQPSRGGGARLNEAHCSGQLNALSYFHQSKVSCNGGGGENDAPGRNSNDATWTAVSDYPIPILDNLVAKDEGGTGLVYGVSGISNGAWTANSYAYDPGSDTWTPIANIPTPLEKPTGVFIGGKLYVANGWTSAGNTSAVLQIYDPSTDSWSTGADNPAGLGGGSVAVALDGKMYVIGGCDSGSCGYSTVEVYDPSSDSWSSAADYPHIVSWQGCGAIGGEIYCAGGVSGTSTTYTDGYVYDPSSDSWSPIADLPQNLWAMAYTATADGTLLFQDGVTDGTATVTNLGFMYDVASDSWSSLPNNIVTTYRSGSACGFYEVGGMDSGNFYDGIQDAEVLPGYDVCAAGPVPWLSFNPVSGTIDVGKTAHVMLTIDGTGQTPGTSETVTIKLSGNTPYGNIVIPMTVNWQ